MRTIKVGGQDRPVVNNFNSIIEMEEITGIDITSITDPAILNKTKNMRALAFCALKHGAIEAGKEVDFTIDEVGKWFSFGSDSITEFWKIFNNQSSTGEPAPEPTEGEPKK